jgi:hypothetical protein
MAWGRWARFGRGLCEGYGLDVGYLLRFSVVASPDRSTWRVSLNAHELGSYSDFDAAIAAAETEARWQMDHVLRDWTNFQTQPKARRRVGRNRR